MNPKSKSEFNSYTPDELRELYEKKADLFVELADDAIKQACIGRTPEQTLRLRQMQWSIDMKLRKAKTPLERMRIMENIFYSQVYGGDGQLAKLISSCKDFITVVHGTDKEEPRPDAAKPGPDPGKPRARLALLRGSRQ